ncbi:hypothetical protein [Psychroserpens luteus]|uniref:Uncharacterized protein n=1 Tax=Psychroserpens luteus TaxID=1434066 RepID=A0ABW5ZTK2_9FLAO|nr:hypothetical protein [Psychroserpens luteus]
MKLFLKIFFLLLIFEILLGVGNSFFSSENISFLGVKLSLVTGSLIQVFSMPINIFGRELPFYAREAWIGIVLTILNIAIQSFIVLQLFKTLKRSKIKNPKD